MCNLYTARKSAAEVARLFDARHTFVGGDEDPYAETDIYPGYEAPIIRMVDGVRVLEQMPWGFVTSKPRVRAPKEGQSNRVYTRWTNARHLEKSMWRRTASDPAHHCLVPFTKFAEPQLEVDPETGRKGNWWLKITDQPIAAFAGLWRIGELGPEFAFLTTEPNPLVKKLHPKAMPVILLVEDHGRWLSADYGQTLAMQNAYPSQLMAAM